MKTLNIYWPAASLLWRLAASGQSLVVHEERHEPLRTAIDRRRIESKAMLPMRIGLQQNQDALMQAEPWLMAVSDPTSPDYGRHWSQEAVIEAFKPANETIQAVEAWLSSHGVLQFTHSDNRLWIAFDMPAEQAENMLHTEYLEHQLPNGRFEVSTDRYLLPAYLQVHVDYVKPGVKGSDITGRTKRSRDFLCNGGNDTGDVKRSAPSPPSSKLNGISRRSLRKPKNPNSLEHCNLHVTPACIRALYNISVADPDHPISRNNTIGIFSEHQLYWQGDLDNLFEAYTNIPTGTSPILKSIDGGVGPLNQLTAQKKPGPPNWWHSWPWRLNQGEDTLDLETCMPIVYPQNVTVFQTDDGYWSKQVSGHLGHGVGEFNTFLDAIDGSYCTYDGGNDPKLDPKYPDPRPHGYKGRLQCGVFESPSVLSSSYGANEELSLPYAYQRRQCTEWLKLGLQGVSVFWASGDEGVGICLEQGRVFQLAQGSGCPWITTAGATRIGSHSTVYDPENGAEFSGGGFSMIFDRPAYQSNAVSQYFQNSNTSYKYFYHGRFKQGAGRYNRNGRGAPDVSACGMNNLISIHNTFSGGSLGTSFAAPLLAAIFNRINEERIRVGKRPVGFVNPTLYQHPELLNDIVSGHNPGWKCSRNYGFDCTAGWDPVTGLGTPNYPKLLELFMGLP